ncbi:MAG: response regulator [Clostridiales bacterium]|nr:response regulator [Clostridiales bacterium]
MLKVFLVEDEFVVREGIKNNIDWSGHGYDFCGEAGDGEVAYSMIQKLKPDIVITDIKMPFMDGLTLSHMIKSEFPWIEIIILTGYEDFQFAREAIKIGVSCYLLKPVNGESIMKEVDALSEKIREKKAEREAAQRYEEEMRERTELDKRDFFNTLIKGGASASDLIAEAKKLSIDISALRYNIMLLKIWSDKHDIGEFSNSVLRVEETVRAIADELGAVFFDFTVEGTALLFKGDDDKDIKRKIDRAVVKMKDLFSGYKHIRYFGAIGQTVGRITEIHTSFDWASRAYAHLYLTSENAFLVGSAEGLRPETNVDIPSEIDPKHIDRRLMKRFLRGGEVSEITFFLEEYLNNIGDHALRSKMLRQYIAMDVYFCVADFVENELGLSKEEMEQKISFPDGEVLLDENKTHDYLSEILGTALDLREDHSLGRYHDVMKDAITYISEHYSDEELSLNTLAAQVNFSPNHLSSIFKQETGQPFIKYLTDYRMNMAKELLRRSSKKSNEIGIMVGYKDPHYFSYLFKKTQGVTPTQYRSMGRGEDSHGSAFHAEKDES